MSSEKPQKMVEILANPHKTFMGGRSFFKCVAAEGKQGRMQAAIRVLGMGAAMAAPIPSTLIISELDCKLASWFLNFHCCICKHAEDCACFMLLELHITTTASASSDMRSDVAQSHINGKVKSMKAGQVLMKHQACFVTHCTWILKWCNDDADLRKWEWNDVRGCVCLVLITRVSLVRGVLVLSLWRPRLGNRHNNKSLSSVVCPATSRHQN